MNRRGIAGKKNKGLPEEMPTSLFLKKEMVAAAEKAVVYNLAEEFRTTRKNRGFRLYLAILLFTLLLLGGTFGATSYIEQRNRNIAIDITDFEDINMQELLYALRNAGKLLDDMKNNMELMRGQMNAEMERQRRKALEEMALLKKRHDLSDAQRAEMMKRILAARDRRLAQTSAHYEDKIRNKEKSIDEMNARMGDYKSQLKQQMDSYLTKVQSRLKEYQSETATDKAKTQDLIVQMGEDQRLKRLEDKKEYEKRIAELRDRIKESEESLKSTTGRANEYGYLLDMYRRALVHYAFLRGEQGHVICPEKDGHFLVVLNPLMELETSCKGMVIDRNGEIIARVAINRDQGVTRARVLNKVSRAPIRPFDMIIIQKE
ncbi:MAG: hypothetical protein JXA20_01310 [Spirochaetes bacterium]|nr:hypothetical protein [Spirochaetota bacterium]